MSQKIKHPKNPTIEGFQEAYPFNSFSSVQNAFSGTIQSFASSVVAKDAVDGRWISSETKTDFVSKYFENKKLARKAERARNNCREGKCSTYEDIESFKAFIDKQTE